MRTRTLTRFWRGLIPRFAVVGLVLAPMAVVASSSLFSGCTAKEKSKDADLKLPPEEQKKIDEYRAEVEIGRNMAGRLLGYYGIVDDEKLVGYLNQVGNYVASYSDYPDRRYMFAILKHESINAFACPGGYILVTMGALRAAKNEAELASILGHEVAHVGKKHMFNTLREMKEKDLKNTANQAGAAGAKIDDSLRVREREHGEETAAGTMLARYLTGSSGAGLNILQAASAGMTLITEKGLDKELEFEADHEGVKYAIRAGYDPKAMMAYLARLEKQEKKPKMKNLGKTHPSPEQRIAAIQKVLTALQADDIIGATGGDRFEKVKKTFPKIERD